MKTEPSPRVVTIVVNDVVDVSELVGVLDAITS